MAFPTPNRAFVLVSLALVAFAETASAASASPPRRVVRRVEHPWAVSFYTDVLLGGAYHRIYQEGLSDYSNTSEGYLVAGERVQASRGPWRLETRAELRSLAATGAGLPPTDPAYATIRPPKLFLPLQWKLYAADYQEHYLSLERLFAAYEAGAVDFYAGRRVVALGVLRATPIWNKFSKPLASVTGPQSLIYGRDSAAVRYNGGAWNAQVLGILGERETASKLKEHTAIAEGVWYRSPFELHGLVGQWWGAQVGGLAFATDLGGTTLRGEGLSIWEHGAWDGQAGLGIENAVSASVSIIAETFYQTQGAHSANDYRVVIDDPFQILQASAYGYLQIVWKWSDALSFSPSTIVNLVDGSAFVTGRFDYAWTSAVDLGVSASGSLGPDGTEFSHDSVYIPDVGRAGVPFTAMAELKIVF